jgi:hypothetical protein
MPYHSLLLVIAGILKIEAIFLQSLPLSSHHCLIFCVSVLSPSFSYKDTHDGI